MPKTTELHDWTDSEREDLKLIPEMIKRGWKPKFSLIDKDKGRVIPTKAPEDGVSFEKKDIFCFQAKGRYTGHIEFKVANLIDNKYVNPRTYRSLDDVLINE